MTRASRFAPLLSTAALLGEWHNYDPSGTGVVRVGISAGLVLSVTEVVDGTATQWPDIPATPLCDGVDLSTAMAFVADADLGDRRVLLCAYLNRGLLTIDLHTVGSVMNRLHFHLW